jgi:hypothetical protein
LPGPCMMSRSASTQVRQMRSCNNCSNLFKLCVEVNYFLSHNDVPIVAICGPLPPVPMGVEASCGTQDNSWTGTYHCNHTCALPNHLWRTGVAIRRMECAPTGWTVYNDTCVPVINTMVLANTVNSTTQIYR